MSSNHQPLPARESAPLDSAEPLTFEWSLRPLLVPIQMFGFQLNKLERPTDNEEGDGKTIIRCTSSSTTSRRWIHVIGFCTLLFNVTLHVASLVHGVDRLKINGLGPNGTNLTTANLLNHGIEHFNYTFILIGVPSVFYIVSLTTRWKSLWQILENIQENLNLKPKFYRKCRKIVLIGLVLLFLDSGSYLYMSISSNYWKMGIWRPVAIILSNITRTAALSVFALFCILLHYTSFIFQVLNRRIDDLAKIEPLSYLALLVVHHHQSSNGSPNIASFGYRIEKWRQDHAKVCRLVDSINECFGVVLLLIAMNGSVSFITTSFEIVRSLQENNNLPFLFMILFFKKTLLLGFILYEPYRLQCQAFQTIGYLRRLHRPSKDTHLEMKLNTVILEVSQSFPRITAVEFFDVNFRLIPTLIGTTLTYVAIMCQASAYYASSQNCNSV